ncbi:helix-turn-helix domain-containing protein, partial [Streptomyces galilaeus]|uniref:helix-turn-helix domain-containing protein n=1 Tax=Streptomyces galilaeus TaxID=33899 RepID=UPI0038F7871B
MPLSVLPVRTQREADLSGTPQVAESGAPTSSVAGGVAAGSMADRDRVVAAMEKSGWVQAKAARLLGLTPRQI